MRDAAKRAGPVLPLFQPFSPSAFSSVLAGFGWGSRLSDGLISGTVERGGEKALLGIQHHPFISLSFISSLALSIKFPTKDIYFPSTFPLFFSHFIYCQLTALPKLSRICR